MLRGQEASLGKVSIAAASPLLRVAPGPTHPCPEIPTNLWKLMEVYGNQKKSMKVYLFLLLLLLLLLVLLGVEASLAAGAGSSVRGN